MEKRVVIIGVAAAVMLTGCSPKSTQLSPNTYLVKCEQMFGAMSDCVTAAKKQCPLGYEVLSAKDENNVGTSFDRTKVIPHIGNVKRSMLIKCQ